jgi:glycosyltransferase involved in cell wall biosynthesis
MSSAVVSIILFAHAPYARFLRHSLGSILTQSYGALDVHVLSDGSEDVRKAVAEFNRDSRVAVVCQGAQPFLQAANQIMQGAKGEYLATWNSDDVYREHHVKLLVDALEQNSALGAAFDNTEFFKDVSGDLDRENGTLSLGLIVSPDRAKKLAQSCLTVQDIVRENFMTGPSSLIRKLAFETVGGYDKDIYLNCDLHWFYRLAAYFPVAFVDYVGVRKRVHPLNNTAVNPHYEYGLRELEHIRERYPEVYDRIGKSTFNKKLGRKYFRLGLYYERGGEPDKARAAYKQAMLLRKWSLRYSWEYCRSSAMVHLRSR